MLEVALQQIGSLRHVFIFLRLFLFCFCLSWYLNYWGTPITNISMRLPFQIPCQTHLPAAGGPGTCFPSDCHLQTLGSLCHPPVCSWANTYGQRRAVPDMWTHSLEVKPTQPNKVSSALSGHKRENTYPDPPVKWRRVLSRHYHMPIFFETELFILKFCSFWIFFTIPIMQ